MCCQRPDKLPPPPPGKTGWPWTEETAQLPDTMPDGRPWPKISIVTPSYNQGQFIEETIRSVLLQGYPNLEYIIMDGGSTDGTVDIIRNYQEFLIYWESKRDKGQADAINHGFARSSGGIMVWINSDDTYEPGILSKMVQALLGDKNRDLAHGEAWYVDEYGNQLNKICYQTSFTFSHLLNLDPIIQPTTFWSRELWDKVGALRVDLNWGFDWDWYIRARRYTAFLFVPAHVANYRLHSQSKTGTGTGRRERHAELAHISRYHGGWFQPTALMYMASVPSYCLEDALGRLGLPRAFQDIIIAAIWAPPKLFGCLLRLMNREYQT